MKWSQLHTEPCPVARGLSVIGDRWTMLVVRECFLGRHRFEQMQDHLGITRHVLADRLRKLQADGVLCRLPYADRPLRHEYRLTDKGTALYPLMVLLIDWAEAHQPRDAASSLRLIAQDTGRPVEPLLIDRATGSAITPESVRAIVADDPG